MEIKIKSVGFHLGTVGWLKKGLEDGSITVVESLSRHNKPGLWLKTPDINQMLAILDPYDECEFGNVPAFQTISRSGDPCISGDKIGCTDACFAVLQEIARQWVEIRQAERDNDFCKAVYVTIER